MLSIIVWKKPEHAGGNKEWRRPLVNMGCQEKGRKGWMRESKKHCKKPFFLALGCG